MSIDKEKQIIEMAKDIHEELETENIPYHECDFMAQRLIKKGWVKSNENSIVLSREEYENIYEQVEQNVLANIADGGTSCHWCIEQHEKKASKETAEKIIHDLDMKISNYAMVLDLPELPEKIRLIPAEVMVHFVKTLKEQFGVEIKE